MSTHDFKRYKEAKALLPHINKILTILDTIEQLLTHFNHFSPVCRILEVIKEERETLEMYQEIYNSTTKNKGKKPC